MCSDGQGRHSQLSRQLIPVKLKEHRGSYNEAILSAETSKTFNDKDQVQSESGL